MNWHDTITELSKFTLALAAIGWLTRTIIVHFLNKDISRYRSELHSTNDFELEQLKSRLSLLSMEHQIRFKSFYEKQAEIIERTYELLYQLCSAIQRDIHEIFPDEQGKPNVLTCYSEFIDYFEPKKLFFSKHTSELAMQLVRKYIEWHAGHFSTRSPRVADAEPAWIKEVVAMTYHDVMELSEQLETDFRKLIGVSETSGSGDGQAET